MDTENFDTASRSRPRPMVTISMRIPAELVTELKRLAPQLGYCGYQPLIRAYIGRGLASDLRALGEQRDPVTGLVNRLRELGVPSEVLDLALEERVAEGP